MQSGSPQARSASAQPDRPSPAGSMLANAEHQNLRPRHPTPDDMLGFWVAEAPRPGSTQGQADSEAVADQRRVTARPKSRSGHQPPDRDSAAAACGLSRCKAQVDAQMRRRLRIEWPGSLKTGRRMASQGSQRTTAGRIAPRNLARSQATSRPHPVHSKNHP